jgi:hypothetical protein
MTDGKPMQAQCGAHCRTTGNPCQNAPMPNGRCRMHGGKSTGRPPTSGYYSNEATTQRHQFQQLLRTIDGLLQSLGRSRP